MLRMLLPVSAVRPLLALTAFCFFIASAPIVFAQEGDAKESTESKEAEKPSEDEEKKKEETSLTVETSELEMKLETDGRFAATDYDEVILSPEEWSSLKVERVVAHGAEVTEGDQILKLEVESLDEQIQDLERSLQSSGLSLRLATDELRFLKESTAMDLEQTNRTAKNAADDLEYYQTVQEEQDLKSAELSLKMSQFRLEYAEEELKQLQQMYEADDLTEQTEEIILKRTARDVEMAKHSLEQAKLRYARQTETSFPRQKQEMIDQEARAALSKAKTVAMLPVQLRKKELEVEQLELSVAKQKQKLEDLKADREMMTVTASRSGIVFYGQAKNGKWGEIATREKQLISGGAVGANQVILTIVDPTKLELVASVSESEYALLEKGQIVSIRPDAIQNGRLWGRVKSVDPVVQADGKQLLTVELKADQETDAIIPGMTAKLVVLLFKSDDAIMVPKSAVFRDEFSEDNGPYVWLAAEEDEEPQKQSVSVGYTKDDKIQITEGLSAGDKILKKAP